MTWLGWGIVGLAAPAAAIGVFSAGGPGRHQVAGLHGVAVTLYGEGLFRNDTLLIGAGNRGQDGVVLFAFVLSWSGLDAESIAESFPGVPSRRVLASYLLTVAALLSAVWLPPLLQALITGDAPALVNTYTSEVTWALDLALIVPVAVTAAVLVLRRHPVGRLLAFVMTVLNLTIGLVLISQGIAQVLVHALTTTEVLGMVVSFAALTGVAAVLLFMMLTHGHPDVPVGDAATATRG